MATLVEVFETLIEDDWRLSREGAFWLVHENNQTSNPLLKVTGAQAFGFSLDKSGARAWPFLKALDGVSKICDAIVITQIQERTYVLAIELKSTNTSKAGKQLHNAWLFTEWLRGLLKLHGHWSAEWSFCGVVSSIPRKQERKGTTQRRPPIQIVKDHKYRLVHLCNQQKLNLVDLDNALVAA